MNRTSSGDSHPLESHDNVAERPASQGEPRNLIDALRATLEPLFRPEVSA